jgi:hypothetical protein
MLRAEPIPWSRIIGLPFPARSIAIRSDPGSIAARA